MPVMSEMSSVELLYDFATSGGCSGMCDLIGGPGGGPGGPGGGPVLITI